MIDISSIQGNVTPGLTPDVRPVGGDSKSTGSFGAALKDAVGEINRLQMNADSAIAKVELEKTGSIDGAIVALEKADISFRAMMTVRNKILEAYQEVMRMQV